MATQFVCQKCRQQGTWLKRVTPIGTIAIWECRPYCGAKMSTDEAVVAAVELDTSLVKMNPEPKED